MVNLLCALAVSTSVAALDASITSMELRVQVQPAEHALRAEALYAVEGVGPLVFRLNDAITVRAIIAGGEEMLFTRVDDTSNEYGTLTINLQGGEKSVRLLFGGTLEEDVEAGERAGAIHNFGVQAHIGENGVFLSDGSAWYPQWIDPESKLIELLPATVRLAPVEGWSFVASGDPVTTIDDFTQPVWEWKTPRPVEGVAIAGNRLISQGAVHETEGGPVEIVTMFSPARAELAPLFIDAAKSYLDLYVPRLGAFPFRRFTIMENFFSSGFAYPGFTLLGPQVVAMGPRSLGYGYLDHEILHNWWGNGVYVDPADGNWCEALATYGANYWRRIADGGEEAGYEWRRDTLMKLSTDPENFDNAALDQFGVDPTVNRFVGYDKGAFVFVMLEHGPGMPMPETDRSALWRALKRFAGEHMGERASWDDLRAAIEAEYQESREVFFDTWVRSHTRPMTVSPFDREAFAAFYEQLSGFEILDFGLGRDANGRYRTVDPAFRVYRVLPPDHLIPTLSGTFGPGGVRIDAESDQPAVASYMQSKSSNDSGENLLLIGRAVFDRHRDLLARASNALAISDEGLTIANETLESEVEGGDVAHQPDAILHTMPHPDRPGRFITVFLAFNDAGWARLRLIDFYTRDTTVQWVDGRVNARGTFEPPRHWYQPTGAGQDR